MTKQEVIVKIKKCLALSGSSNEHEAAAALRQAQALMQKYGIEHEEMLASDAGEAYAKAGVQRMPSNWETWLANAVANAFGCTMIFSSAGFFDQAGKWIFIGCAPSPEIASYAFQVLYRQLKRQRAVYIKAKLQRCKLSTRTKRADLFCDGWVQAVASKLTALAGTEQQEKAISAYINVNYPALRSLEARDRNAAGIKSDRAFNDWAAGKASGREAELNRGVGTEQMELLSD